MRLDVRQLTIPIQKLTSVCFVQPAPHTSFTDEIDTLKKYFADITRSCNAYVMGDNCRGLQWHVFVAGSKPRLQNDLSLEVCMTGLSQSAAEHFVKDKKFVSSWKTTCDSGISDLLPGADIDDFVFWPCGYSMNGLLDGGFITIHVTPEESCSYASVEFTGFQTKHIQLDKVMNQVVKIFQPENLYVAATITRAPLMTIVDEDYIGLRDYACCGMTTQKCPGGVRVLFGSFGRHSNSIKSLSTVDSMSGSEISDEDHEHRVAPLSFNGGVQNLSRVSEILGSSFQIDRVPDSTPATIDTYARKKIAKLELEDTFYVLDLSVIDKLYKSWVEVMPRISPFYAVKCNPNPGIIALLAALGAGFDCASEEELRLVLSVGAHPNKIIFANPCKHPRDIRSARDLGVPLTTYDTEAELTKMQRYYPECKLVLRIRADDPSARCQLGNKYGAEPEDVYRLLSAAKDLGLDVVGVSFHVGSGAQNPSSFKEAIHLAHEAMECGHAMGFKMQLLDIGGGFHGGQIDGRGLGGVPEAVNAALATHFPVSTGITIIAEPGRYFAEAAATLMTFVYGRRERLGDKGLTALDYWITDGLYGSFNCIPYDHASVVPRALKCSFPSEHGDMYLSTIFGPTCDGLDTVLRDYPMPQLDIGDWIAFSNMGAYTIAGAANFNGFNAMDVDIFYVWADE